MSKWEFQPASDLNLPAGERFKSVKREPGLITWSAHALAGAALRAYFRVYHRLAIIGGENLPRTTPFVVIANHGSHLDALALAAALPVSARVNAYPIAAGDVFFENAATSFFTSIFINALPLWRKKVTTHALAELRERLAQGHSGFILFPEGARTRDGNLLPFKPGLGMLVAGTDVPVVPCHLSGCFEALNADQTFPRPRKIIVRAGPALRFGNTPDTREGWMAVAAAANEAVLSLAPPGAAGA